MAGTLLILLLGLELKHYVADYLLQPRWLLVGKGNFTAPGGYVHAGVHAFGTALVLLVARVPPVALLAICGAEFVVHYAIDYVKYRYGSGFSAQTEPWRYWAVHGLDQLLHQATYAAITVSALAAIG